MKLLSLLAFAGTLPLRTDIVQLPDWRKPFAIMFAALHESRRRQAAREIGRHQHLLDRHRASAAATTTSSERADEAAG
jgi:hypothetical protein